MRKPFDSKFRVASPYGLRTDPITGEANSWHNGVDLVSEDKNVRAVLGGTVLQSRIVDSSTGDRTWEWGNYVAVWGSDNMVCYYCHLDERAVELGQRVVPGQIIGIEGNTGRSTGVHLHFEVRDYNSITKDPCAYIGIPNQVGYVWKPEDPWIAQASPWAAEAVDWAVRKGILQGRGGDDYALKDPITREEMCLMLYRAREVL